MALWDISVGPADWKPTPGEFHPPFRSSATAPDGTRHTAYGMSEDEALVSMRQKLRRKYGPQTPPVPDRVAERDFDPETPATRPT